MKVFVFDTETSGLPKERNPSIYDTDKWPHIMQISYSIYNTETGELEEIYDAYIRLNTWVIVDPVSEGIHGITREIMEAKGVPIQEALIRVRDALSKVDICVGHNVSFDKRMIMVECIRLKKAQYFTRFGVRKPEYCTMKTTTELCAIEKINMTTGEKYFKYPNLSELHEKIFGNKPKGTHDSMADILICLRCCEMLRNNVDFVKKGCSKFRELYNLYC